MGFDFNFRSLQDEKEVRELGVFLRLQSLGYPNYQDWVTRTREELLESHKTAILAFSGGTLVGDLIFQPHKTFPNVREIKNLRVHPNLRGRYFGTFMLRQGEVMDEDFYGAIILDVRSDQIGMINSARALGYEELVRAPLYEKDVEEVVMVKRFQETEDGFFVPIKRDLTSN